MRRVAAAELPEVIGWLQRHAAGTVFLESNLRNHGLAEDSHHARAVWLWAAPEGRGFIGLSRAGIVMPQMASAGGPDWSAVQDAMTGLQISGVNGEAAQVGRLLSALGIDSAPANLDRTEPQFTLDLARLVMPAVAGLHLTPIRAEDRDAMIRWRRDYCVEVMGASAEDAPVIADHDIDGYIYADSHRILWRGEVPVAFTGFNARLPDMVQIGGVYTPPALRGQGLARAAVALHLAEARAQGILQAGLCAASDMAARAYVSLGFQRVGSVRLLVFSNPAVIGAAA